MNSGLLSNNIHKALKTNLNETSYILWLSNAKICVDDDYKKVKIISSSLFKAQTIESALYKDVEKAVHSVLGCQSKIDYLFKDENGNIKSILEGRESQRKKDEMCELLEKIVFFILNNNTQAIIQYVAPDIKKGVLNIENDIATLEFNNLNLLKIVKEHCTEAIIEALTQILDRDSIELKFLYCGSTYQ